MFKMLKYIKNLISALFTKLFDGQEGQEAYAKAASLVVALPAADCLVYELPKRGGQYGIFACA